RRIERSARGAQAQEQPRSYKSWALNDDHPKLFRGQVAGRPTPSFTGKWCREKGRTVDVHMRRARRADGEVMWRATLPAGWADSRADERAQLNREEGEGQ